MNPVDPNTALLRLLQLASPALPVGAYSYSEGLEWLAETGSLTNGAALEHWLTQELRYGAVRLEAAVLLRAYRAMQAGDRPTVLGWNSWLSAARETAELRSQSWQMGRSLIRLIQELSFPDAPPADFTWLPGACNFAIAFGLTAAHWQIDQHSSLLAYLQSWATNLINAGVKLIPLGQTAGQQLLVNLQPILAQAATEILTLEDNQLETCGWGLTLASMNHETQYSRLFRS